MTVRTPPLPAPAAARDGDGRRRRILSAGRAASRGAGLRRRLVDWWPLLLLAVLAFAVRWPNLWYIPQFTDEVFDAQVAHGIWEGKRPLIGVNAYTGAFHYYLQAAIFWLIGPGIYSPRALVAVLGVGAVLATAVLGADLGRRAALGLGADTARAAGWVGALVAGGLLATSVVHVIMNSHLAWPHATLPLYLTLAFVFVERAVAAVAPASVRPAPRGAQLPASGSPAAPPTPGPAAGAAPPRADLDGRAAPGAAPPPAGTADAAAPASAANGSPRPSVSGRVGGRALVAAGLCFGLAQQQHPTMLVLWPVFLGYVAWRGRAFFRTRWAYGALVAFVVAVSPLIAYNLSSGFGSLKESREQSSGYQEGRADDFSYRGRAVEIAESLPRILASAVELRPAPAAEYLRDPRVLAYTAVALLGLAAAARLGAWSLPLAVAVFLAVLPAFPASHDVLPRQGRYLMPMVPLLFAGCGGLAALLWLRARSLAPARRRLARIGLAGALGLFVLYPLVPLARYELDVLAANETNDRYFVTLGALERQRRPAEPVVLDPTLKNDRTGAAGTALRTFDFMMELRGIPRAMLDDSSERIIRRIDAPTALVVADLQPSSVRHRNNADTWVLEPLENDEGGGFTLWRITRR